MMANPRRKMNIFVILFIVSRLSVGYVTGSTNENDCMQYRMVEKLTLLENENSKLLERITKLEQRQNKAVSAYVRLSESTNLKSKERVMYDIELSNIGGAFNFRTGQFTAPVSGIYSISVTSCLSHGQWSNLDIMEDGLKIGNVRAGALEMIVDCSSASLSTHLKYGGNIWVESGLPSLNNQSMLFEGRGWNTFMATLIHAD